MSLGIKSSVFLKVEETDAQKFEVQMWSLNKSMQNMEFDLKWVHTARYELILKLDGALWRTIISKTPLTPRKAMEGQKNRTQQLSKISKLVWVMLG